MVIQIIVMATFQTMHTRSFSRIENFICIRVNVPTYYIVHHAHTDNALFTIVRVHHMHMYMHMYTYVQLNAIHLCIMHCSHLRYRDSEEKKKQLNTLTWNTACDLDEVALASVGCWVRFRFPISSMDNISLAVLGVCLESPATTRPFCPSSLRCKGAEGTRRSLMVSLYT